MEAGSRVLLGLPPRMLPPWPPSPPGVTVEHTTITAAACSALACGHPPSPVDPPADLRLVLGEWMSMSAGATLKSPVMTTGLDCSSRFR